MLNHINSNNPFSEWRFAHCARNVADWIFYCPFNSPLIRNEWISSVNCRKNGDALDPKIQSVAVQLLFKSPETPLHFLWVPPRSSKQRVLCCIVSRFSSPRRSWRRRLLLLLCFCFLMPISHVISRATVINRGVEVTVRSRNVWITGWGLRPERTRPRPVSPFTRTFIQHVHRWHLFEGVQPA